MLITNYRDSTNNKTHINLTMKALIFEVCVCSLLANNLRPYALVKQVCDQTPARMTAHGNHWNLKEYFKRGAI